MKVLSGIARGIDRGSAKHHKSICPDNFFKETRSRSPAQRLKSVDSVSQFIDDEARCSTAFDCRNFSLITDKLVELLAFIITVQWSLKSIFNTTATAEKNSEKK